MIIGFIALIASALTVYQPIKSSGELCFSSNDKLEFNAFKNNNVSWVQSGQKLFLVQTPEDYESERQNGKTVLEAYVLYSQFEDFLNKTLSDGVDCILTDYAPTYAIPKDLKPDTVYVVQNYHFWYYKEVDGIGRVAFVYSSQLTVFSPSEAAFS
jgi:hypothetical protein